MKKILFTTLLALILTGCENDSDADFGGVTLGTVSGNLDINSQSSLDAAITDGTYINAIGGNLVVSTGGSTGITVGDVKFISSQINSVGGNVTINTPDGSLDLSELTTVGGNYSIQGSDANDDKLLTVDGDITLNYEGDYDMPNLTSVGNILLTPVTSSASKNAREVKISFINVIDCISLAIAGTSDAIGILDFTLFPVNDIAFGPGILVKSLIAPVAIKIQLLNLSPLPSLFINAPNATNLSIATTAVNGSLDITADASGVFNAPELNIIGGNTSITAGTFSANKCTRVDGNLSINSNDVSMTTLGTVVGNVSVIGSGSDTTANSVNFANLSNVGGSLSIDADDVNQNTGQPHNSGGNSHSHNSGGNSQPHNSGGNG
ncbi:membrane lipoprotein lipid attachment site-containing protein [Flavobacteriaceae bacterium]|nr:membrane lipoprotein lipid attachment site-containing protein [Flavobacteriaceae bacterium]